MTAVTPDPKHALDEFGVLGAPRFVPKPPARQNGGGERIGAVAELIPAVRANPGKWAAIVESANRHAPANVVTAFHRGRFGPAAHWETACRRNPDTGRTVLYVRYVGPRQ